jgi:CRISPR-associated exonuclease Cas4
MHEDDFLPLSGVQHLVFCERQAALIHVERVFEENVFTTEGRILHDSVATPSGRGRDGVRVETDVWLRSEHLGLVGRADRVESWKDAGRLRVQPVESKRAKRRSLKADCVQLCAQAMALEEMRGVEVDSGELYYIRSRRRLSIPITRDLREATIDAARRFHEIFQAASVPPPRFDARCKSCSLKELCLPAVFEERAKVADYLTAAWSDHDSE